MADDPKNNIYPDDEDVRPEEIARLGDSASFDPIAQPHIYQLSTAVESVRHGDNLFRDPISSFNDPEKLKKFGAARDYAFSDAKHAEHVRGIWDKFVQCLKEVENDNPWSQALLKRIDEFVEASSAPEIVEANFHSSWGTDKDDIVININRFYGVITIDGKSSIYMIS
jgi:hypothetical protein